MFGLAPNHPVKSYEVQIKTSDSRTFHKNQTGSLQLIERYLYISKTKTKKIQKK